MSILPEFIGNPFYEELLRKEYEIGYELEHPNICKVYSYTSFKEIGNCIEMEWVDGTDIRESANIYSSLQLKNIIL